MVNSGNVTEVNNKIFPKQSLIQNEALYVYEYYIISYLITLSQYQPIPDFDSFLVCNLAFLSELLRKYIFFHSTSLSQSSLDLNSAAAGGGANGGGVHNNGVSTLSSGTSRSLPRRSSTTTNKSGASGDGGTVGTSTVSEQLLQDYMTKVRLYLLHSNLLQRQPHNRDHSLTKPLFYFPLVNYLLLLPTKAMKDHSGRSVQEQV